MNIAIVEDLEQDSSLLLSHLKQYMQAYDFDTEFHCFSSGEAFLAAAAPERFDLCFMDIYMGGMDGVATAEQLRAIDPECLVIFLTSSPDYINDAFRLRAWRYLLKPVQAESLREALSECIEQLRFSRKFLTVTVERRETTIPFSGILYIITADRSIEIHGKDTRLTVGRSTTFEELAAPLLQDYRFLSIGRGLVINMSFVESVDKGGVTMTNGVNLPISRGKQSELSAALVRFRFSSQGGF